MARHPCGRCRRQACSRPSRCLPENRPEQRLLYRKSSRNALRNANILVRDGVCSSSEEGLDMRCSSIIAASLSDRKQAPNAKFVGGCSVAAIFRYFVRGDARLAPSVVMSPRAGHLKSSARPVEGMTASPVLNTRAATGSEVRGNFSVGPPSKTFSAPTLGVVSGSTGPASGLVVPPSLPFLVCTS